MPMEDLIARTITNFKNLNKKELDGLFKKIAFDLECSINYSIDGGKTIEPIQYVGKKKKIRTCEFTNKIKGYINKIGGDLLRGTQFECIGKYDFGKEESLFNRLKFLTPDTLEEIRKEELALIDEVREYISKDFSK